MSDLFTGLLDQENYDQGYTIRLQKKRERKLLRAIRKNDIAKVNALADGRREITQLLIQYHVQSPSNPGPDLDDDELLIAAGQGCVEILKMLIEYRKKLGYKGTAWPSHQGDEPIHRAATWAAWNVFRLTAGAAVLLASGADVNALTTTGDTPILMAAGADNEAAIKELLKSSPDLHQKGLFGETVLLVATSSCSLKTVRMLVAAGADIHCRTKWKASVLHLAAEAGKIKTFKWILDNSNLTIDDLDCHNWTPLHFAACKNQVAMANLVESLIQHGADVMALADSRILHFGGWLSQASRTNMYWTSKGNTTPSDMIFPLHCAASSGGIKRAKALLSAGADIHTRTAPGGKTALHLAARNSLRNMVRFLVQGGLNHRLTDTEGHTMVHCLSLAGEYEPISVKDFLVAENLYGP
ncbi:hypothetical protein PEX2_007200 [Penicillium expansum]|uniref:Uncharacterized protein n=1 Tax=Penicillium expansum TaxID=27334 RepID=A0A0A2J8I9_PENEN|nr:hypothetical protein PEX2_007200 [Penicillium expansum]KGO51644.1 hypothetical protein PEX2_007200 [Penicillium expansum]